MYFDIWVSRNT